MVVGSGMIATRFDDYKSDDRFVVFASGVSISTTIDKEAFDREKQLLQQIKKDNANKVFVYFSTCSIYDETLIYLPYVQHKMQMESLVSKHAGGYVIFRVSNPIGKTNNRHTILNYFIYSIQNKQPFTVYSGAERNLIDLDDMYSICHFILQQSIFLNSVVTVANPNNYSILYIIKHLETYFLNEAIFTTVNKRSVPMINTSHIVPIYQTLKINFGNGYLMRLLQKYYPLP